EQKRLQLTPLSIKVLLVALAYPSYEDDCLVSSIPSLALFREHLIGGFGCKPNEIKFLTDYIADVPTSSSDTFVEKLQNHDHIMQILGTMAEGAKQGDKLIFFFSGHGLKIDEEYCMDLGPDQDGNLEQLYGDEIDDIMENIPDGATFHPFYDCCHSAGIPLVTSIVIITFSYKKETPVSASHAFTLAVKFHTIAIQ
ncbi:metacaspase type ii, partial [Trifolium pratense]